MNYGNYGTMNERRRLFYLEKHIYIYIEANEIDDLCDWLGNKQDI